MMSASAVVLNAIHRLGGTPGTCPRSRRHWFTGPDHGAPHDQRLADAMLAELRAADIQT